MIVIHHNSSKELPPEWLRKYINKLARYLCIHLEQHNTESEEWKWKLPQQNVPNGIDSDVSLTTDAKEENKQSTKCSPLFQLILNIENTKREKEWIKAEWQWVASV